MYITIIIVQIDIDRPPYYYHLQTLYLPCTVYRERDKMAREFALTTAKRSLLNISLHTSDLGRPCLVDKWVVSLDSA